MSSLSICWCIGEGFEDADGMVAVGDDFSSLGVEEVGTVVGGFTVVGISGVG